MITSHFSVSSTSIVSGDDDDDVTFCWYRRADLKNRIGQQYGRAKTSQVSISLIKGIKTSSKTKRKFQAYNYKQNVKYQSNYGISHKSYQNRCANE
jgi:hypothetical protein